MPAVVMQVVGELIEAKVSDFGLSAILDPTATHLRYVLVFEQLARNHA